MIKIDSQGPLSRHITEYLTSNPRVKQYKCKTLQNPDYFYNGTVFAPVDVAFTKDTVSNAGNIWLRDKAIVSVGTKKTDDAYKLFGLRPDENQGGSEQFEVSIESIEINGKSQTINLRDRLAVSPITTKFGDNLYLQHARQRTRVMIEGNNALDGFRIALRLHLKGLTVTYRADLDEYWIYNDKGQFRFRLGKPYLVDPITMNPLHGEFGNPYPQLVKHSLIEISKGEYRYIKEPTEVFGKISLPLSYLIDADTVYSTTADGRVSWQDISWATLRAGATGNASQTASVSEGVAIAGTYDGSGFYYIYRTFFYYDTSGVVGTITACDNLLYGITYGLSNACAMKGTQAATLTTADYDSFSGNSYGNTVGWSTSGYNTISFDATGLADIDQAGTTKVCIREKAHDYDNVQPAGTWDFVLGCYFADASGTANDPYLLITTAAAGPAIPVFMAQYRQRWN